MNSVSRILSTLLVIILSIVLSLAFGYQILYAQIPCPLCFLQRAGMIGAGVGQLLNFRFGISMRHHAITLFHCILSGAISLRQISFHICPDFSAYGIPVLGLRLYSWSFLVFVCTTIVIGILMLIYNPNWQTSESRGMNGLEKFSSLYLFLVAIANLAAALILHNWAA